MPAAYGLCVYDCSHTTPTECRPLTALPASVQHASTPGCSALVRKSSHRLGSATAESAWRASRQHFIRRYPADRAPACQFSAAGVRDPAIRSSTSRPCLGRRGDERKRRVRRQCPALSPNRWRETAAATACASYGHRSEAARTAQRRPTIAQRPEGPRDALFAE